MDKIKSNFVYTLSLTRIANLQQSYDLIDVRTGPTLDCGVSRSLPIEKIFYLLENYFEILAGSQVSDRCPLGYLFCIILAQKRILESNYPLKIWTF